MATKATRCYSPYHFRFEQRKKEDYETPSKIHAIKATTNAAIIVENLTDAFPAAPVKTGATALLVLPWKVLAEAVEPPVAVAMAGLEFEALGEGREPTDPMLTPGAGIMVGNGWSDEATLWAALLEAAPAPVGWLDETGLTTRELEAAAAGVEAVGGETVVATAVG